MPCDTLQLSNVEFWGDSRVGTLPPALAPQKLRAEGERVRLDLLSRALHAEYVAGLISRCADARDLTTVVPAGQKMIRRQS